MKSLIVLTFVLFFGNIECQNISDVLTELKCFQLRDALTDSGLMEKLDTMSNITLFAPTDKAITDAGGLPVGADLTNLLQYHVIGDHIESSGIENELNITSLNGATIRFNLYDGDANKTAQGALIDLSLVDQQITNGSIHVLNAVMTPPTGTIYEYLSANADTFSTLLSAIHTLNLTEYLNSTSSAWTGFAPTETAFQNIPSGDLLELLGNNTYLEDILYKHVAENTYYSAGLNDGESIMTYGGDALVIDVTNDVISLKEENYAVVTTPDVSVTNGVLHVIDRVLDMPVIMSGSNTVCLQISLLAACLALAVNALKW